MITRWLEVARMAWNVPGYPYSAGSTFLVMLSEYSTINVEDIAAKVLVIVNVET